MKVKNLGIRTGAAVFGVTALTIGGAVLAPSAAWAKAPKPPKGGGGPTSGSCGGGHLETVLGYTGSRPTSFTEGKTITLQFADEKGYCGATVEVLDNAGAVATTLPVTASTSGVPAYNTLTAFNPQYGGSNPNADSSTGKCAGQSTCAAANQHVLTFSIPNLPNDAASLRITGYDGDKDYDVITIPVKPGGHNLPAGALGGLGAAVLAGGGLFVMQRRSTLRGAPAGVR